MRILLGILLSVLLLAACGRSAESERLQSRIDSLERANQRLRAQLKQGRTSHSETAGPQGRVLEPPLYFPSGSAWLPDRARRTLDSLATVIKERYANRDFRIQGYTDSVPIGPRLKKVYPSNWYLSAQRAAAVAHYLDQQHQIQTHTLAIGAYGPQEPAASNETFQGRQQNRRVEIVVEAPRP